MIEAIAGCFLWGKFIKELAILAGLIGTFIAAIAVSVWAKDSNSLPARLLCGFGAGVKWLAVALLSFVVLLILYVLGYAFWQAHYIC